MTPDYPAVRAGERVVSGDTRMLLEGDGLRGR
jgi:hypothetical protein